MKTKNVFAAFIFMLAIGSAFASEFLMPASAWTRKADVPSQEEHCEQNGACTGSTNDCMVTFDPDGPGPLSAVTVPGYDGTTQNESTCGVILKRN